MNYQAIRIFQNGRPTYGDKYVRIISDKEYTTNDLVEKNGSKYIILFKEE